MIFYFGSKRYRWRFSAMHPLLQGLMIILGTLAAAGALWMMRVFAWMIWAAERGIL